MIIIKKYLKDLKKIILELNTLRMNYLLLYFSITDLIDKKIYLEISDPLIDLIEVYIKKIIISI